MLRDYHKIWLTLMVLIILTSNVAIMLRIYPEIVVLHAGLPNTTQHTYVGGSYPMQWDIPGLSGPVEMTFTEIEAYPFDGPAAKLLWYTNRSPWTHSGFIRLGPERRCFAISMFHQLHCVNTLRLALADPDDVLVDEQHVQHCLSYLRQFFLCAADDTLEPYDFMDRTRLSNSGGHTRTCRDWSVLYHLADANFEDWEEFSRHSFNVTSLDEETVSAAG